MPWYKSGTVSVTLNSNAVIGAGTAFIANSRVGDAFRGPDGGWYEVTNIASDTAMSISPNYQGATNGAGAYALAPMQGYVKDSADTLRSYVNQFGTKLAALGTTGNYDILPIAKGGTGGADAATARTNLGLGSAAIENIVPLTKGGTGNATGTATKLAASAILGAVAQSGGLPTGAIIERGSNSNGWYVKFADGTLICYAASAAVTTSNAFNSLYYSAAVTFTFAAAFVEIPQISAGVMASTGFFSWAANEGAGPTTANVTIRAISGTATATARLQYTAIGRWF